MNRLALAALFLLLLAGCVGSKPPKFVAAAAESNVEAAETASGLPWRSTALEGEGRAPADSLGDGDTAGLRVAAAAGDAIAAARADLRRKTMILPAPDGGSLSRFIVSQPSAGTRIDELIAAAPATHRFDAAANEAVGQAKLELEPVAVAVLEAVKAGSTAAPTPDEAARERALREARLELRNRLLELPVAKRLTVADQIRWDVILEAEVARAVRNAAIVRDEKSADGLWSVELQASTKPVLDTALREK